MHSIRCGVSKSERDTVMSGVYFTRIIFDANGIE